MVLKTAESIAEESRGLTYLYPRTVGKREKANLAVHRLVLSSHVTHGLPRALARSPLTLAFSGCL